MYKCTPIKFGEIAKCHPDTNVTHWVMRTFYLDIAEYMMCQLNLGLNYSKHRVPAFDRNILIINCNIKVLNKSGFEIPEIIIEIYRSLVGQSALYMNRLKWFRQTRHVGKSVLDIETAHHTPWFSCEQYTKLRINCTQVYLNYSLVVWMIFWILAANILTKCISNLLLNVFLVIKSDPYFHTLADVVNSTEVSIAGNNSLRELMQPNHGLTDIYDQLYPRMAQYEDNLDFSGAEYHKVLIDVVMGRAVIFAQSMRIRKLQLMYPTLEFKRAIEGGLYQNHKNLETLQQMITGFMRDEIHTNQTLFRRKPHFEYSHVLTLEELWRGGFALLAIGLAISCLTNIGEKLWSFLLFENPVSSRECYVSVKETKRVAIGLIAVYLVRFYVKVFSLPRGPFPLPVVGNALRKNTKVNQFVTINELHKTYGRVFTVWIGGTPMVVIAGLNLIKTAFNSKNNELMGRPKAFRQALPPSGSNVAFTDYGPVWASLRRVAHSAVRKLVVSEKLSDLVDDIVDETVQIMKKTHPIGTPFNPKSFIYAYVLNIIASSAFGKRYEFEDKELKYLEQAFEYIKANSNALVICDRIPVLKLYPKYAKVFAKNIQTMRGLAVFSRQQYMAHLKTHSSGVVNDFCDALIEAKEEAIQESKENASHLTDENLSLVILDLFFAGTDNTQYTMRWILLLMANNREMQIQMRDEIESVIGDRVATHEDRNECHFVNAFIAEALRYRGITPFGLPHVAMADMQLDKYHIKEGTFVFGNLVSVTHDPNLWPNPDVFDPKRFLTSDGKFGSNIPGFTPFGIGRRICFGEKLALADLFFITVRLLKSTNECVFALQTGDGSADLEADPNIPFLSTPKPYEITLEMK
ncbi:unnamed protein product, partial [Medioppia subpectinata]